MKLLDITTNLEQNNEIHLIRLLILIGVFSGKEGDKSINGLMKLAKLDFLLRYPTYLEEALRKKGIQTDKLNIKTFERNSIESSMIRYKYGPWDHRYRKFINILIGKGLVNVKIENKTIIIGLTGKGFDLFNSISNNEIFLETIQRAHILKTNFNISGTNLKNFIYETFPGIVSLKLGESISYEN